MQKIEKLWKQTQSLIQNNEILLIEDKISGENFLFCARKDLPKYYSMHISGVRIQLSDSLFHLFNIIKETTFDDLRDLVKHNKSILDNLLHSLDIISFNWILDKQKYSEFQKLGIISSEKTILKAPQFVAWNITNGCNMNCIHCSYASGKRDKNELTTKEAINLIDQIYDDLNCRTLWIGGGEPTIRQDLVEILKYAYEKGLRIIIISNGKLINKRKDVFDAMLKYCAEVTISLDGAKKETHEFIRNENGNFERTIYALNYLCKNKKNTIIKVNTTVSKHNLHEIGDIIDLCAEMGVDMWSKSTLEPIGRAKNILENFVPSHSDLMDLEKILLEKKEKYANKLKIEIYFPHVTSNEYRPALFSEPTFLCGGAIDKMHITPTGDILPCGRSYDLPKDYRTLGNVKEKSLLEIWKESQIANTWRHFEIEKSYCWHAKCQSLFSGKCQGGCKASAIRLYGSPHFPGTGCPGYDPITGKYSPHKNLENPITIDFFVKNIYSKYYPNFQLPMLQSFVSLHEFKNQQYNCS